MRFRRNDYVELDTDDRNDIPLRSDSHRQHRIRQEQSLEAEVQPGDTLNTISMRFNCSVQDIKRLNKIDKDNEIYAFKVVRVPQTVQNVLLDTLPKVHKSGNSSPKNKEKVASDEIPSKEKLEEKLLLASVSNAVIAKSEDAADRPPDDVETTVEDPLLDNGQFRGYPKTFGAPRNDYLTFNGSDCELNWIVLLVCILALCVIVPLIYVWLVYEHPEKFVHEHSKYDDPDIHVKQLHHLDDKYNSTTSKL